MFRRIQTLMLALLTALLIILGGVGIFIAEASSISVLILDAQSSYDAGSPVDAVDLGPDDGGPVQAPGYPF